MCTETNEASSIPPAVCPEGVNAYEEALSCGSIQAASAPRCLVDLGLLRPSHTDPERLAPVPPSWASSERSHRYIEQIQQLSEANARMSGIYAPLEEAWTLAQREVTHSVTELRDESAIGAALQEAVRTCKFELLTAQPGGGRTEAALRDALGRVAVLGHGVRQRTLYQHAVRRHHPTLEYIRAVTTAGAVIRTVDDVFDRLIICDRAVAFIPVDDHRLTALQIRHPGLIRYLAGTFERAWERGVAIGSDDAPPNTEVVVEVQHSIARLLVAGHTEESIGRRLGISRRTVAEHVKRISLMLGSVSRTQLGYLIATSGLFDEPVE